MSKYEELVFEKVKKLFNTLHFGIETNYRPDWLKNPLSDNNLELDICVFLDEINGKKIKRKNPLIAFEIQGEQHFQNIRHFNNDSDISKYRDNFKAEKCYEYGIPFIEVFYVDINKNLNLMKLILQQYSSLSNDLQRRKLNQIFQILKFNIKHHHDVDKWEKEHLIRTPTTHTLSNTFLRNRRRNISIKKK